MFVFAFGVLDLMVPVNFSTMMLLVIFLDGGDDGGGDGVELLFSVDIALVDGKVGLLGLSLSVRAMLNALIRSSLFSEF